MDNAMNRLRSRLRLAASSGALILALTLAARPAQAQSFNATATPGLGAPSISTGAGTTTITINAQESVIDWNALTFASTAPFIFQNAGTTATFTNPVSGPPLTDYTVLNRIFLSNPASGAPVLRAVQFDGTVTSTLNGNVMGNIWFYSPTGIIAGAGSLFNVGSLVLTTNDIDTTGGLYGSGNSIRFRGVAGSTGYVDINAGATLRTTNNKVTSQYVALVAPRVVQAGTIQADGQVALVGAEQADISINLGLLNLVVSQGTTDANGIVHTGTTTGAATTSAANKQVIQMVAMPKNTALTMMLSGNIGYTPAALASNEGSAVVLSAGYGSYVPRATQALALGNMTIADATIRNALTANATDTILVQPTATNAVNFQADASLTAGKQINVIADDDSQVSATGKLDLKSGFFETGGKVNVRAINTTTTSPVGRIAVTGDLTIDTSGAADPTDPIAATSAAVTGGTVLLDAQRGTISSAGLTIKANAQSADAVTTAGNAGAGKISVQTAGGGSITAGIVDLQARGTGGTADSQGGRGSGGTIEVLDQGGTLNFTNVTASSIGRGGVANTAAGRGGDGIGGAVTVDIQGNTAGWSRLTADTSATAGLPLVPGSHSGNAFSQNEAIILHVGNGANFYVQGDITLDANALAGIDGTPGNTFADAGGISVSVDGKATLYSGGISGATGNIVARADARIDAQSYRPDVLYTPNTFGGLVSVTADGGSIRLDHIYASATAEGAGAATAAGQALGGSIQVGAINGGQFGATSTAVGAPNDPFGSGNLTLDAGATGAGGPSSANATGGSATLYVENGTLAVNGQTTVKANAGASQFDGQLTGGAFVAQGGTATLETRLGTGTGSITLADAAISADGNNNGASGNGLGGTAQVAADGDLVSAQALTLSADGTGAFGGAGQGGTASLSGTNAGTIRTISTGLSARGIGGSGAPVGGTAGKGTGGAITLSDTGSTLDLGQVQLGVRARGGSATLPGTTAGDAVGGTVNIAINSNQPAWSSLDVDASVLAGQSLGSGGFGGSAQGSTNAITLHVGGGGQLTTAATRLDASAIGALDGAAGSFARGGSINVLVDGGGTWTVLGDLTATAVSRFSGLDFSPASQRSPQMTGGAIDILANGGTLTAEALVATAWAEGAGLGASSGTATGGKAQAGVTNGGRLTITPRAGSGGLLLDARGLGSGGVTQANAQGGSARLYVQDGQLSVIGATTVKAGAEAGPNDLRLGGGGFNATGGTATAELLAGTGTGSMTLQGLTVDASGLASMPGGMGGPIQGDGGAGRGGTALAALDGGTLTADAVLVQANGQGGYSGASTSGAFQSGNGQGGSATFAQSGGTGTLTGAITVNAQGTGGGLAGPAGVGETPARAGNGSGGSAALTISAGTLVASTLALDAGGAGGIGMDNANGLPGDTAGRGGDGSGGSASLTMPAGSSTADLRLPGGVSVLANGQGGSGGTSTVGSSQNGAVGAGFGGAASIVLADGHFALGNTALSGSGANQAGSAAFELVDSLTGPAGRTLGSLDLRADGQNPNGTRALTRLRASVLTPAAGLTINGDLTVFSRAADPTFKGFDGQIDGASLNVTGLASVLSAATIALDVGAGQRFDPAGSLTMTSSGAKVQTTGLLRAGGAVAINGLTGIAMTDLQSGATTDLTATQGGIVITQDLRSPGVVQASGQSIDITSRGALSFTTAQATAGNLAIRTLGNLDAAAVSATGLVSLTSDTGALHTTGAVTGNGITLTAAGNVLTDAAVTSGGALTVQAGGTFTAGAAVSAAGNVAITATQGLTAARVTSGGTTQLGASNGAIAVTTDLVSPGAVTASGRSVDLVSSGALSFAGLTASAGNASVTTAGDLVVTNGSASAALSLISSGGAVTSGGSLTSGGTLTLNGARGISLNAAQSGATASLQAAGGDVTVAALGAAGVVDAQGRSLSIASPGALSFATARATAGNLTIQTAGNLDTAAVSATGSTSLTSSAGAIHATGLVAGNGVTLAANGAIIADAGITSGAALTMQAGGSLTSGAPLNAAGNVSLTGAQGITAGQVVSGGTTQLSAANGAIAVTADLVSPGAVTANGRSVSLTSSGALTFAGLTASTGDASVTAAGALVVPDANASGALNLVSSGAAVRSGGTLTAGGNLAVSGPAGVTLNIVRSGGTTNLQAASGAISVAALSSPGAVSAQGRTVSITSPGALSFAQARATGGDLVVQTAGDLAINAAADATGAVTLTSTGGTLTTRTLAGAQIDLAAPGGIQIDGALAQGTLTARTGGLFRMRGASRGASIAITSADIDLGTFALGQRGTTQTISLTNGTPAARTFVGGADNQGGYTLSAAEALQLFADRQITIAVGAGTVSPADMVVGDLALAFGSNLGAGGTFKLNSTGRVSVEGAVQLRTVSAADTFAIDPTRIDVVTDRGSIGLVSASNAPLGNLILQGGTIAVANAATLAALGSAGSMQAINALLDQPASNPRNAGYLVAGSIGFDVTQGLFIQNTGLTSSYADRRGFTAGTLSISTAGRGTQVVVNGQTLDPSGIAVTGLNTARTMLINGVAPALGGAFDPQSSINGCVIGLDCTFVPGLRPDKSSLTGAVTPSGSDSGGNLGVIPLISIAEQQENGSPPLIDEPVTGVGNDDLWQAPCEEGQPCQSEASGKPGTRGAQ